MGGCFSVSLSCDQAFNQLTQCVCVQVSYIHNIEKNLTALETTMEELKARRNGISNRVEREEYRGLRRTDEVNLWLSKVETVESEVNEFLRNRTNQLQRLCFCGFCSTNLKSSYSYGKQILDMLEKAKEVKAKEVFEEVAEQVRVSEVVERPIQPNIVGQKTLLERAWNHLNDDEVGILGLYGMGGVGKTTLLEQINNKFKGSAFNIVIWVVVSKDLQIQKIQEEVAKKLGLDGEDWNHKNEDQKACDIHSVLRRKKFVLLLDDLWAKVDLKKIGVLFPNRENGSKVVFTTRSKEVCGRMGVKIQMEVQCLSPEDALDLFQTKVGENTLGSHPDIPELAKVVANKCRGLPLALNVIGEAMSYKQIIQEWNLAIEVLNSNAAEFPEVEDEILPILKYSFDNLISEQVKSCLLYCALFPEDHKISKDELIEKWICEGIIDDSENMHKAHTKGNDIIFKLVRSSLLMEEEEDHLLYLEVEEGKVYMHDIVREMTLWIASDCGKQKDNFVVYAGSGLCEMPNHKKLNDVKRMSLMDNKISHISGSEECLQLTTLFLQNISLGGISSEFFKSMLKLVVLDLSSNPALSELPDGISELVSLKYLNISDTDIPSLPVVLQKLKNLIHLDLEETWKLSSIVGISALLNLKVLKLLDSRVSYSSEIKEELKVLEQLEILTISIYFDSRLDEFLNSPNLMCSSQVLKIKRCQLESSDICCLARMEKLRHLSLLRCTIPNTASITREMVSPLQNLKNSFFLSLSKITLRHCKCPKELTWLMFAPNLTMLVVEGGNQVEEITNKEKACEGEESGIVPFQKLEYLLLEKLPELKNIYYRPLPFPCLKLLNVINCPMLRKLPLNSKSGEKGLIVNSYERERTKVDMWEDEATEACSLPSFPDFHLSSFLEQKRQLNFKRGLVIQADREWLKGVECEDKATEACSSPSFPDLQLPSFLEWQEKRQLNSKRARKGFVIQADRERIEEDEWEDEATEACSSPSFPDLQLPSFLEWQEKRQLNSRSARKGLVIQADRERIEEDEWEDEATEACSSPSFPDLQLPSFLEWQEKRQLNSRSARKGLVIQADRERIEEDECEDEATEECSSPSYPDLQLPSFLEWQEKRQLNSKRAAMARFEWEDEATMARFVPFYRK